MSKKKNIVKNFESCPVCGGRIVRENQDIVLTYNDNATTIEQAASTVSAAVSPFWIPPILL